MLDSITLPDALQLLETCPTPMLILDREGHVSGGNVALLSLLEGSLQGHAQSLADMPLEGAMQLRTNQGERHFRVSHVSLADGGEARFFEEVTGELERARLARELQAQTLKDPLTGLLSQRGLMVALEPQVSRSRRYSNPLSVIVLEASGEGDGEALQLAISQVLKDQVRWADLVGIADSREFILALPETSREDALRLAHKLGEQLEDLRDAADRPAQIAYGVTEWGKQDNAAALLKRACQALKQARSSESEQLIAL